MASLSRCRPALSFRAVCSLRQPSRCSTSYGTPITTHSRGLHNGLRPVHLSGQARLSFIRLTHRTGRQRPCLNVLAQRRALFELAVPAALKPPLILLGLAIGLYIYKCFMLVVFQDKIIYMPSMPPLSRYEGIEDYAKECRGRKWDEVRFRSLDGTRLAMCVGSTLSRDNEAVTGKGCVKRIVVLYLQGNASSTPPRLPFLSVILRALQQQHFEPKEFDTIYTVVALAYRGYWKSSGRASQRGIELDAQAALKWIQDTYGNSNEDMRIVIWGQSIGSGVASFAAKHYFSTPILQRRLPLSGVILETPFTSIRDMLVTLYPQKWLPYRYLWPFLWNHWDSEDALRKIASLQDGKELPLMIMPAGKDELVPATQSDRIHALCLDLGLNVTRKDIPGAFHQDVMFRSEGRKAVVEFLQQVSKDEQEP